MIKKTNVANGIRTLEDAVTVYYEILIFLSAVEATFVFSIIVETLLVSLVGVELSMVLRQYTCIKNLNGSNTFGTMKICSRQGWFELMSVKHSARSGSIIGISFQFSST